MRRNLFTKFTALGLAMVMALSMIGCRGHQELPVTSDPVATTEENVLPETSEGVTESVEMEMPTETSREETTEETTPVIETSEQESDDPVETTKQEEATTKAAESTESTTTEAPTTETPTTEAPTTEAPTTVAPTTEAPTTVAPTTEAPTTEAPTTEAPTTEAPTTAAPTPQSLSAKVKGTYYIGDSLGAGDFTVTVTMSDGSTKKNPAGWSADQLYLGSAETVITITYQGLTTTVTVNASERPTQAPTQAPTEAPTEAPTNPPTEAPTQPQMSLDRGSAEEAWRLQVEIINREGFSLETKDYTGRDIQWSEWLYEEACRRAKEISENFGHYNVPENCAENIGRGYTSPEQIIQGWYESSGHKRNMLAGAAYGAIARYGDYWVALFKQNVPY